jgi:hypothetical protein
MAAFIQTNEIGFKRTSVKVTVPDNDIARLMYYLNCVCTAIDCNDDADIQRYISYQNWQQLSVNERKALVVLCYTISPDVLNNKVFFQYDALCIHFSNEFYEISQVRNQLLAAESIVIAGRTRQVNKIMVYKQEWLRNYYIDPIRRLASSFSNSPSSAVTYQRSNSTVRPITYTQPVVVRSNGSNKGKYICCGIVCFVLCVVPIIIGIIVSIVNSKK